jgi:hypothetical protein
VAADKRDETGSRKDESHGGGEWRVHGRNCFARERRVLGSRCQGDSGDGRGRWGNETLRRRGRGGRSASSAEPKTRREWESHAFHNFHARTNGKNGKNAVRFRCAPSADSVLDLRGHPGTLLVP